MRKDQPSQLLPQQKAVCDLLAWHLFESEAPSIDEEDWPAILREGYLQGVQGLVCHVGVKLGMNTELEQKSKQAIMAATLWDFRVHASHSALHRIMVKHALPYAVIKGVAAANYYPNPCLRRMGDVDFLVDRSKADAVLLALADEEFEIVKREHDTHIVLRKDQIRFEMHLEPAGMPEDALRNEIDQCLSDMLATAVEKKSSIAHCVCPSDFHHGLILLMHTHHHLLSEGVGLRHLCDWAAFVGHFEEESFAELFGERLKRVGLWQLARLLSVTCSLYLGLPQRDWMGMAEEDRITAKELICDVFQGGNFGVKDPQRAYEGMFISNRGKESVKQNRMKEGFSSLNRITYQLWPVTQKAPILLPIGWLVSVGHFVKRNRERKKHGGRIDAVKAYRASSSRMELYRKLSLYQPEE